MLSSRNLASSSSLFNFNSHIWKMEVEYKDDFKKIVFEREISRPSYQHRSLQLSFRTPIVDYMKSCASNMKLTHCCLHLAVYLFDIFMDNHSVINERLHLLANTCLLIAAKFEEITTSVPKIKELNNAVDNIYTVKDYIAMECFVLKFYNWYIMYPTVAHYVSYFLRALMNEEELEKADNPRSILCHMHLVIRVLMDKTIDDVHYMQFYLPSKLAAAIIYAARENVGLSAWDLQLEELTQYSQEDIKHELLALTEDNYFSCGICSKINTS